MKKVPYIKIRQRESEFLLLKLDIKTLRKTVNFHFRDPYLDEHDYNDKEVLDAEEYRKSLEKIGIDIDANLGENNGIQRRLSLSRVKSIEKFIQEDSENILPGCVILSYNTYETDPILKAIYNNSDDYGLLNKEDFSKGSIIVIDGQHRLAGLLTSTINEDFEIPVSLFLNSSLSESSRLFRDINGNQKSVNRSFIYDLYSNIETEQYLVEAKLHKVCKILNTSEKSPFYNQIKMLGTGSGFISQSFFIEYGKQALKKLKIEEFSTQEILDLFLNYFRIVQSEFQEYWPVTNINFQKDTLKNQLTSQLIKTNGIGALFIIYPYLYSLNEEGIPFKNSIKYFDIEMTNTTKGTGKASQNMIAKSTLKNLISDNHGITEDRFTKSIYKEIQDNK